jgi:hypothetical protein
MKIDAKVLEAAKAEHGADALRLVRSGGREYLLRRPTRGEFKRFRKEAGNDKIKDEAIETIVLDCLVFPTRAEFEELLEKLPALCEELGEHVFELAGLTGKASLGKL